MPNAKLSDRVKAMCLCYWRFRSYCPIVATEYPYGGSDVVAITTRGEVVETEVKVSLVDLRADIKKEKHGAMRASMGLPPRPGQNPRFLKMLNYTNIPHRFFFGVPQDIAEKALEIIETEYPYAGLLVADTTWSGPMLHAVGVEMKRSPRPFPVRLIDEKTRGEYQAAMGTAVCKFALRMAQAREEAEAIKVLHVEQGKKRRVRKSAGKRRGNTNPKSIE